MRRLRRLIAAGLLCCLVSVPAMTAGATEKQQGYAGELKTEEGAETADLKAAEGEAGVGADTGGSHTVSGSDAEETDTEESFLLTDISDMVYQAGGWGTPAEEYLIQPYAITDENALKAEIFNALQNSEDELDVRKYNLTSSDGDMVYKLIADVINENPSLFYVSGRMGYSASAGEIVTLDFYYYDYSREDKENYAARLEQAAALVTPAMTDMEKALVLHDYLAQNCAYAYREYLAGTLNAHRDFYSAYGALVEGRAVCQGYALAYDALLRSVGINSFTCSSADMNHAWNIILLDGEWYHVDVTWDDPVWNRDGTARHEYFLLSDAEMGNRKHYGWSADAACTSTKYDSYWWRNVNSQIVVLGGAQYCYISDSTFSSYNDRGFQLKIRNGDTVSTKYSSSAVWEVWNGGGGYYTTAYSYLSSQGGCLYFNDKQNLYAMRPSDSEPRIIYTYKGGDGYLYGAMVYGDGTARLNIGTTPNRGDDSYITIDLKGLAPVLTADYANKTLPTTASMEYSLDNGAHWARCTDHMKLEAFGWNGSREISVLVRYLPDAAGGFTSKAASVTLQTRPGTLGGTVLCPGNRGGQTTVQILDRAGRVAYETKTASCSNGYVLQDVASGTYTLRISRPAYVTREYPLTVADQGVSRNVEIWLVGDVNGDGGIDARDKRTIYNHMAKPMLTGYEFLVGDVDGSGEIDARDKRLIYNHIAGTSLLWQ